MTAPFDIFQKETDGSVLWLGSAKSLEEARARASELAAQSLRDHIILNHTTGNKLVVNPGKTNGTAATSEPPATEWKVACLAALSEADVQKAPEKMVAAKRAVEQRLQELVHEPEDHSEKIALYDASRAFDAIKNSSDGVAGGGKKTTAESSLRSE